MQYFEIKNNKNFGEFTMFYLPILHFYYNIDPNFAAWLIINYIIIHFSLNKLLKP